MKNEIVTLLSAAAAAVVIVDFLQRQARQGSETAPVVAMNEGGGAAQLSPSWWLSGSPDNITRTECDECTAAGGQWEKYGVLPRYSLG